MKENRFHRLISRFRREERGVITIEVALAASVLGLGFAALLSTVSSVDNSHNAEQAMNDMVLTVRALPDVQNMRFGQLRRQLTNIARENLGENQRANVRIRRICGCQLENRYAGGLCRADRKCRDGSEPGRFVEIDLRVRPRRRSTDPNAVENFSQKVMVQYRPASEEDDGA